MNILTTAQMAMLTRAYGSAQNIDQTISAKRLGHLIGQ